MVAIDIGVFFLSMSMLVWYPPALVDLSKIENIGGFGLEYQFCLFWSLDSFEHVFQISLFVSVVGSY